MFESYGLVIIISSLVLFLSYKIWIRLRLSRAKHPSLRGHSKWSRRVARLVPFFEYSGEQFYCSDGAPEDISIQRRLAFEKLGQHFRENHQKSIAYTESLQESVSDMQFTNAYRVPYPYRSHVNKHLKIGNVVVETNGVKVKDLDGKWSFDLTGSYGVNVFGYDFYKECMQHGYDTANELGPVLGSYHPVISSNVEKLKTISGLDEVSFHMSGTEAVMQAVRLARYHTGKTHLVRFCGAYHGWWDGVQPGIGNRRKAVDIYTLKDMSEQTLLVLNTRNDIACVLINPLQALHPNSDASSDGSLINSTRSAKFDRPAYTRWLQQIREVCTRRSIVLIFDEVFTGFRLAYRGAQEYFSVQADMVTYGKTVGGGLPIGVVCGKSALMKRFKYGKPVDISFARGTFNSHPYVMTTMNEFLTRIEQPEMQSLYQNNENIWNSRVSQLNTRLAMAELPVRVVNMSSIWTIIYTLPGRYNWMFQYYLRAQGVALSWVGSGRVIMSHNFSDDDFEQVMDCFISAANTMESDGWWWQSPHLTNEWIKKQMLLEMIQIRVPVLKKQRTGGILTECQHKALEGLANHD